jgi:hypothetical protein
MDKEEIKRRQQEGFRLRRELGDQEYRKIKAARRRQYYEEKMKGPAEALGLAIIPCTVVPVPKPKIKAVGCMVGIMVVDDAGEHVYMWNAPNLKGTMMPGKQNINGYKDAVFDAFQKAFGKLSEQTR